MAARGLAVVENLSEDKPVEFLGFFLNKKGSGAKKNEQKKGTRKRLHLSECQFVRARLSVRLSRPGRERGVTGFLHGKQPTESSRAKKPDATRGRGSAQMRIYHWLSSAGIVEESPQGNEARCIQRRRGRQEEAAMGATGTAPEQQPKRRYGPAARSSCHPTVEIQEEHVLADYWCRETPSQKKKKKIECEKCEYWKKKKNVLTTSHVCHGPMATSSPAYYRERRIGCAAHRRHRQEPPVRLIYDGGARV